MLDVSKAMKIKLSSELPPTPDFDSKYRRAPDRGFNLTKNETVTALKNALRYVPSELHETLAPEFLDELLTKGRIYGYRYSLELWRKHGISRSISTIGRIVRQTKIDVII